MMKKILWGVEAFALFFVTYKCMRGNSQSLWSSYLPRVLPATHISSGVAKSDTVSSFLRDSPIGHRQLAATHINGGIASGDLHIK